MMLQKSTNEDDNYIQKRREVVEIPSTHNSEKIVCFTEDVMKEKNRDKREQIATDLTRMHR